MPHEHGWTSCLANLGHNFWSKCRQLEAENEKIDEELTKELDFLSVDPDPPHI